MNFQVHPKEKRYYAIMLTVSLILYACFAVFFLISAIALKSLPTIILMSSFYLGILLLIRFLGHAFFMGHIRGNGIRVHQKQFPEVFEVLKQQSEKLGLAKVPTMYLLEGGGFLNAFATKFRGHNYVVLYSDVLAAAYKEGMPAVKFIIGHELGHIKRNHLSFLHSLLLFPARMIPFLGKAYSRAREYTCDNIGFHVSSEGAEKGLLILAAGSDLYKKVQVSELLLHAQSNRGFALWFAEIFSTHPHLVNRIARIDKLIQQNLPQNTFVIDKDREAVRQFNDVNMQ